MSQVEAVLEKLGVATRRQGNRIWAEQCPLPTHGKHNVAHSWQNFFSRADRGEWSPFFCFSCKGSGNLVELVMLLRVLSYREAREWVRTLAEQEPVEPFLRVRSVLAKLPGAISVPDGVQKQGAPLETWNSVPRNYVLSRGITDAQVRRWGIGYALEGRLAGRIFLPIFDRQVRLANYAARTFVDDEKRYLAAGSWEQPDKQAMFGEHRWPAIEKGRANLRNLVFVFEGALNGLAIESVLDGRAELAGMSGLDESDGGQIDVRSLMKLATFRKVVTGTDPDGAGDRAALAIERALRGRVDVVRLRLPEGKDAADLRREDPMELRRRVADAFIDAA